MYVHGSTEGKRIFENEQQFVGRTEVAGLGLKRLPWWREACVEDFRAKIIVGK